MVNELALDLAAALEEAQPPTSRMPQLRASMGDKLRRAIAGEPLPVPDNPVDWTKPHAARLWASIMREEAEPVATFSGQE